MSLASQITLLATRVATEFKAVRGSVDKSVTVATGSEARPGTTGRVWWIGGTTQPTNMATNDVWLKSA